MKRCPKCGLVHPDSDEICRRCRVDLQTGEPVALSAPKASTSLSLDLAGIFQKPLAWLARLQEAILPAPAEKAEKSSFEKQIVYCMECGGKMERRAELIYPAKFIYPLLGLGIILLVLGFFIPLLFISAGLSILSFIFYFTYRVRFWRCTECGAEKSFKPKAKG